uniref:Uncharacterized protein n=1 Tax=Rhizophora mucronata TaxID=61149 RepID=A0A2P2PGI3_RHIMU
MMADIFWNDDERQRKVNQFYCDSTGIVMTIHLEPSL